MMITIKAELVLLSLRLEFLVFCLDSDDSNLKGIDLKDLYSRAQLV